MTVERLFFNLLVFVALVRSEKLHHNTLKEIENGEFRYYPDFHFVTFPSNSTVVNDILQAGNIVKTAGKIDTATKAMYKQQEIGQICNNKSDCFWEGSDCKPTEELLFQTLLCVCPLQRPIKNYNLKKCLRVGEIHSGCSNDFSCEGDLKCINNICTNLVNLGKFCRKNSDCHYTLKCFKFNCTKVTSKVIVSILNDECHIYVLCFGICNITITVSLLLIKCIRRVFLGSNRNRSSNSSVDDQRCSHNYINERNDSPPIYSEIFMITSNSGNLLNKLPTYEEAMEQAKLQSEQLSNPAYESNSSLNINLQPNNEESNFNAGIQRTENSNNGSLTTAFVRIRLSTEISESEL